MLNSGGKLTKCDGRFCYDAITKKQKGKGSFRGWTLWICDNCGQIVKMEKT